MILSLHFKTAHLAHVDDIEIVQQTMQCLHQYWKFP